MNGRRSNKAQASHHQRGTSITEYIIFLSVIALVSVPTIYLVGDGVKKVFVDTYHGGGTWEVEIDPNYRIGGGPEPLIPPPAPEVPVGE